MGIVNSYLNDMAPVPGGHYTQVIFAAILGILFLGEMSTLLSFAGYVIIIGVAVLRWRYNLKSEE